MPPEIKKQTERTDIFELGLLTGLIRRKGGT